MSISAVSPGVNFSEIDATTGVPAVSTTTAAIAGVFKWGPLNERTLISSETNLAIRFGKPTNLNAETFFSAADFLSYSNSLFVTRIAADDAYNAGTTDAQISNEEDALEFTGSDFIARYPGVLGNSIEVSICPSTSAFSSTDVTDLIVATGSKDASVTSVGDLGVGDILKVGNPSIGYQNLTVATISGTDITFDQAYKLIGTDDLVVERRWRDYLLVDAAPDQDSVHIVIRDNDGEISGVAGNVLEVFQNVSILPNAKTEDGSTNYYKSVVNNTSSYVWATQDDLIASGDSEYTVLTGGTDGDNETDISIAKLAAGYDLYVNTSDVDVSLILQGKAKTTTLANYIIDNIAEVRKDCIVFISPSRSDVVNNQGSEVNDIITFRNALSSTSYAVLDTGYKYRYDKYNDVYRYTPLNGDIAGLTARTDDTREPWFSPAGYNRGIIKNVVKLPFNPNKAQRDELYIKDINPVITEPGQGTLLFGDKTLLGKQSAFNRINVRRLFIILEKAIAKASKSSLWELNDEFTRASFRNLVEPFLRNVQGRRGIYEFLVVCDDTNNTPQVIDSNQFVADIYIKPARSINFVQLNFIAVRTGVEFKEIVGRAI